MVQIHHKPKPDVDKKNTMSPQPTRPHFTERRYKYIHIQNVNYESFEGHPVYRIFNNKTKVQLGIISWYKPWREYVFSSKEDCIFNITCLGDVEEFMKEFCTYK